jgi:hypothetical protein
MAMKKVPVDIQREIKSAVYEKADKHCYLQRDRSINSNFMDNLVRDPEVGVRLANYMGKSEVRTYIKDAILNRYSKDKVKDAMSLDAGIVIDNMLNLKSIEIEADKRVGLYRLENNDLCLLSRGTSLKWETALRKALEYISRAPKLPPEDCKLHIVLHIVTLSKPLPESDIEHLRDALRIIGVLAFFT